MFEVHIFMIYMYVYVFIFIFLFFYFIFFSSDQLNVKGLSSRSPNHIYLYEVGGNIGMWWSIFFYYFIHLQRSIWITLRSPGLNGWRQKIKKEIDNFQHIL